MPAHPGAGSHAPSSLPGPPAVALACPSASADCARGGIAASWRMPFRCDRLTGADAAPVQVGPASIAAETCSAAAAGCAGAAAPWTERGAGAELAPLKAGGCCAAPTRAPARMPLEGCCTGAERETRTASCIRASEGGAGGGCTLRRGLSHGCCGAEGWGESTSDSRIASGSRRTPV